MEPSPAPEPKKKEEGQNVSYFKPLRTFEDDVNSLLKSGGSLASAKIAEDTARRVAKEQAKQEKAFAVRTMVTDEKVSAKTTTGLNVVEVHQKSHWGRSILAVLVGLILLGGGGFSLYKLYLYIQAQDDFVPTTPTVVKRSPIIADSQTPLEVSTIQRGDIIEAIQNLEGGFQELILYKKQGESFRFAQFAEVRNILGLTLPQNLERLITDYMFGTITTEENHGFIAFNVSVFEGAMSGMGTWEPTLVDDLAEIVNPNIASSSPSFQTTDVVVRNRDTRVFTSPITKKQILVWGFISKNIILITDNTESYAAILDRYLNGSLAR